jgi:MFS family permease
VLLSRAVRAGPFAHRDFRRFFAARVASGVAIQIVNVGVGWHVYDLTGDPFALGLVGLSTFLPSVFLALLTGHVADRFERRRVLAAAFAGAALAVGGLLLLVLVGSRAVAPVFALVFLFGSARAFANPAAAALLPSLVPVELLRVAVTWNSMAFQGSIVLGPATGGLLWLLGGPAVFGSALAAFLVAILLVASLSPRPPAASGEPASLERILAGFNFIRGQPLILGAISLDMVAVLLGGATALLPIFAKDILELGPAGLGALRAAPAVGAVLVALGLARWPLERRVGRTMLTAVAVFGLAMAGFGLSESFPLSLLLLALAGAADMVSVVVRQTLVQLETPDAMRGRVAAVNTLFIGASNELGEFESGVVARLIGTVPATVLGGLGTVAAAFLWSKLFPELRERDRLLPETAPGGATTPPGRRADR